MAFWGRSKLQQGFYFVDVKATAADPFLIWLVRILLEFRCIKQSAAMYTIRGLRPMHPHTHNQVLTTHTKKMAAQLWSFFCYGARLCFLNLLVATKTVTTADAATLIQAPA